MSSRDVAELPSRPLANIQLEKPGRKTTIPIHWALLGAILLVAFVIRVWGARYSLPFVYGISERQHFVPNAISFFLTGYNPKYFQNPPAYTYLLHAVYALRYGGSHAVDVFFRNPSDVYLTARIVSAALGTLSVGLVYLVAKRLFNARVAVISSALMAVAFLPIVYSHRAVNDVPTLVPVAISLLGSVGILQRGKSADYITAGAGLGLACASKYLGGIVLAPLLAAAVLRMKRGDQPSRVLVGVGVGAIAAGAIFFVANPFAFLDYREFLRQAKFISPRRFVVGHADLGLGTRIDHGIPFYLWVMTWGLGWIPSIAAATGSVLLAIKNRAVGLLLVPAPILYVLFMGARHGYFARYLLPIFPFLVILAGYSVGEALNVVEHRLRRRIAEIAAVAFIIVLLLAQSLAHSIHADNVLTQPDTRLLVRNWIFNHVPANEWIYVEPIGLDLREQITYPLPPDSPRQAPPQPSRRIATLPRLLWWGGFISKNQMQYGYRFGGSPGYVPNLRPELIDALIKHRVCWVVSGSNQWGRAFNDAEQVPDAIAYYDQLRRRGKVLLHVRPYSSNRMPQFDFELSNNFYRLDTSMPGPEIIVYQMPVGRCPS